MSATDLRMLIERGNVEGVRAALRWQWMVDEWAGR